jgi:hypothetical protein
MTWNELIGNASLGDVVAKWSAVPSGSQCVASVTLNELPLRKQA